MFRKLTEGDIFCTTSDIRSSTCGPRIAKLPGGGYVCVFMVHNKGGCNDFVPMAAYSEDGLTWGESTPIWPDLIDQKSVFVSVRNTGDGRVCLGGKMFPIDVLGESFWSNEIGGMKENQLVYALSEDGRSFPALKTVDLPYYGSAENPGGMLCDADGTMTMIYAPYPAIEQRAETDTCCLVMVRSTDGGETWVPSKFGKVDPPSLYAESWIVRLTDGRLMASSWQTASAEAPDQYFLSSDNGETFSGPYAMPFRGQSTALAPWKDNTVLVVYNQRKESPAGVWLALAKPDETGFHLLENEPAWIAANTTLNNSSSDFENFTNFAFGEPHVAVLPDDTLLVSLWYEQGEKKGIRYVHLCRE